MNRRERQKLQLASALARGHYARVLVLAREHLAEFPDDVDVAQDAAVARAAWELPSTADDDGS